MRCCVSGCKNDSRHISKSQGITFHVFPNEQTLRNAWLKALGKDKWMPKERSAICSEHFLCEDLYETKHGLRKVKVGAVPVILQICRICLVSYGKMFSLKLNNLIQAYQDLTSLSVEERDKKPQMLCSECAARLISHSRFRTSSLKANSIMNEILKKQHSLTVDNLATINRENNELSSPLKVKHYEPNHHDLYLAYEDEEVTKCKEDMQIDDEVQVKNEVNNDVYFDENIVGDSVVGDVGHFGDMLDRDYSSDDSVPLIKAKRKKKKLDKKEVVKVKKKHIKTTPAEPKIDRRRKPFLNNDLSETLFTISDLTYEEQVAEIEKRQESANYKNAVFKCIDCFKGFLDEDAYNGHITRHTNQCGEYECEICKTHFKHQHALRKHITAHHTQRFSCNQCPYVTTHRQTARLHERWHKGTKYNCPHCQDEFVKFTTYMGHIRIKHPSDFVCELCGYSFVSAKGIELHKKLKHRLDDVQVPLDGPYCELCNVRFISIEAHKRHLSVSARHSSENDKDREANNPKKGRKSKETKEREKRTREKNREPEERKKLYPSQLRKAEGPIPCEQCDLQLEDSRAYHSHFRRMHPDKNRTNYPSMKTPCMCEVCGRMFQSQALLKDHRWVHTGERPFKCDLCEKSFRMKQRLVAHRRVHAHARALYTCEMCGKNFSTHSNRQRHMFIHTGLKPFKCEMCGKGFKHASEKRTHVNYVHLKKPWPKRARGKRRTDSRQGPILPHSSVHQGANEMEIQHPIWPPCDQKLNDINAIMDDKPLYYNLKV